MILNHGHVERAVNFIKYIPSVVSLIFPTKALHFVCRPPCGKVPYQGRIQGLVWASQCYENVGSVYTL